jgi:hypothetical protein
LVGAAGFEPTMAVSKTAALPLGYAPIILISNFKYKILSNILNNFEINFLNINHSNKVFNKTFLDSLNLRAIVLRIFKLHVN